MDQINNTEDQLRENVRDALTRYRNFHAAHTPTHGAKVDANTHHHLVSQTQVESAMRILWMEN